MSGAGRYGTGQHADVAARAMAKRPTRSWRRTMPARTADAKDIPQGGLNRAGQWAQLMPTLDQAQYAGPDRMQSYGQFLTRTARSWIWQDQIGDLQRRAGAAVGAIVALRQHPVRRWRRSGGTKITTQNAYQPTTLQKIGGGAIAGAGLGSMFRAQALPSAASAAVCSG